MGTSAVSSNNRRAKAAKSALAVALAMLLALGGTLAWSSLRQSQTNVTSGTINAGGRLHDDFIYKSAADTGAAKPWGPDNTNHDKDVYVENYLADVPVYARVRLSEYMEIGDKAGQPDGTEGKTASKVGSSAAVLANKATWDAHTSARDGVPASNPFSEYFTWTEGGQSTYMPTFNMNNTSEEADVRGKADDGYATYKKFAAGDKETGNQLTAEDAAGSSTENASKEHVAQNTGSATVMSMAEWQAAGAQAGPCWVYDADGWAYWAQPIAPKTATGLLLDDIKMTGNPGSTWYYAIHAEAQIVDSNEWHAATSGSATTYYLDKGNTATMSKEAFNLLNVAAGKDDAEGYSVNVSLPEGVTQVEADSYVQATATVTGPSGAIEEPELIWTVSGAGDGSTVDENGLVKVAPNAWGGNNLTITAALKQYPTVKGSAAIKVAYSTSAGRLNTLKTMPVSQAASDTVTIDGIKWYKLAQEGDRVMIWAADAINSWNASRTKQWGASSKWATLGEDGGEITSSNVRTYLNGEFIASLSTLGGKAVDTIVHTRSDYKSEYNQAALDSGKTQITPEWYDTTDKAFVLSEADLFGTAGSVVDADGKSVDIATAKDQRDYTVPNATVGSPAVSTALRSFNCDFTYWSWLRSPCEYATGVAVVYSSSGILSNALCSSPNGALRPALWVDLASS